MKRKITLTLLIDVDDHTCHDVDGHRCRFLPCGVSEWCELFEEDLGSPRADGKFLRSSTCKREAKATP